MLSRELHNIGYTEQAETKNYYEFVDLEWGLQIDICKGDANKGMVNFYELHNGVKVEANDATGEEIAALADFLRSRGLV